MKKSEAKWHHEITHFPGLIIEGQVNHNDQISNFCSYFWMFTWKACVVIPVTTIILGFYFGCLVGGLIDWIGAPWVSLEFYAKHHIATSSTAVILLLISLMVLMFFTKEKLDERKLTIECEPGYTPKPPGFFLMCYKKFKVKYCPKMEY